MDGAPRAIALSASETMGRQMSHCMISIPPVHRAAALRAFSLIELIAVMVVLAILAGVAIPKYIDYGSEAKTSAMQGSLAGVRTAIENFYNYTLVEEGKGRYPTLQELTSPGVVLDSDLPLEPYANNNDVLARNAIQAAVRTTSGNAGWCYYVDNSLDPPQALFYGNCAVETTLKDENGQTIMANQL